MDKLIYLFLLLILFVNSINTKFLLVSIFCFVGLCLYYKKKQLLIIGLIVLYILSLYNNKYERFTATTTKPKTYEELLEEDKKALMATIKTKDVQSETIIDRETYSNIYFIFTSLLDKTYYKNNKESINDLIDKFGVTNVLTLSDYVINKDKLPNYNNFLEKITCLKNNKVNNFDCKNDNYKKIKAFSELIKVYTFSTEYVIKLINNHKIYKLCDLENHLKLLINKGQYGYEYNGYMVYLNKYTISNKYFKILELLGLDKKLQNKNAKIPLKEKLYNYVDKNTMISKDLNSLAVMFDYYKILDELRINNEEDDFDWDYSVLRNIDLNKNYWNSNELFKKYRIKQLIIDKINELTKEDKNIFRHELNKKYDPPSIEDNLSKQSENEYKVVKTNDKNKNQNPQNFMEKLNLQNIKNNFVKTFIEIIDDFTKMYKNRCKIDCKDQKDNYLNMCLYYFNTIIKICIKDGRMFYVGIFIIFISLMLYFIDASK